MREWTPAKRDLTLIVLGWAAVPLIALVDGIIADRSVTEVALAILGAMVLGLVLIAVGKWLFAPARRRRTDDQLRRDLTDWLLEDDYSVELTSDADAIFHLVARNVERDVGFNVVRRKDEPDHLLLHGGLEIGEPLKTAVQEMDREAKNDILATIRIRLAQMYSGFEGLGALERPGVHTRVLVDADFDRWKYTQALQRVVHAFIVLRQTMTQELRKYGVSEPGSEADIPADPPSAAP